MSIGAVAARAGRRPSSIRYYEQIGLLPRPDRVSGRRVYGPDTVRTLAVIETGQRAGLTLDEIRDLLAASGGDRAAPRGGAQEAARGQGVDRAHRDRPRLARGRGPVRMPDPRRVPPVRGPGPAPAEGAGILGRPYLRPRRHPGRTGGLWLWMGWPNASTVCAAEGHRNGRQRGFTTGEVRQAGRHLRRHPLAAHSTVRELQRPPIERVLMPGMRSHADDQRSSRS
jgi:DNA-binding transcriptional MerR regulator